MAFTKEQLEAKIYYSFTEPTGKNRGKNLGVVDQKVFEHFFELTNEESTLDFVDHICALKNKSQLKAGVQIYSKRESIDKLIKLQATGKYSKEQEELLLIGNSSDNILGVASREIALRFDLPRIIVTNLIFRRVYDTYSRQYDFEPFIPIRAKKPGKGKKAVSATGHISAMHSPLEAALKELYEELRPHRRRIAKRPYADEMEKSSRYLINGELVHFQTLNMGSESKLCYVGILVPKTKLNPDQKEIDLGGSSFMRWDELLLLVKERDQYCTPTLKLLCTDYADLIKSTVEDLYMRSKLKQV